MQKGNRKLVAEWCIYEDQIIFCPGAMLLLLFKVLWEEKILHFSGV